MPFGRQHEHRDVASDYQRVLLVATLVGSSGFSCANADASVAETGAAFRGLEPCEKPRADFGFASGVEISCDGRWLLVANTIQETVSRIRLDGAASSTVIKFNLSPGYFWPENLHWNRTVVPVCQGATHLPRKYPGPRYQRPICAELAAGIVPSIGKS